MKFLKAVLATQLLVAVALLGLLVFGCAWGAQNVRVYQADGATIACEAKVRFFVLGTGETTQTSGSCGPYATTTKDTGFSDNAVVLIPDLVKKAVEGAAGGLTGGAPGVAGAGAGVLLEKLAE